MQTKRTLLPVPWMAVLGLCLFCVSLPSLVVRMITLSGDPVHQAILDGQKVDDQDLALLEASRRKVISWYSNGELLNDMALVSLEKASRLSLKESAPVYREAHAWQQRALQIMPADAYGWYRLSYFLFREKEGPSAEAAQAWRLAMITAPYEPRLTLPRLQMGMSLGSFVSNEMESYILRLARAGWSFEPERLVGLAVRGNYISVVEKALAEDPTALQAFRSKMAEGAQQGR